MRGWLWLDGHFLRGPRPPLPRDWRDVLPAQFAGPYPAEEWSTLPADRDVSVRAGGHPAAPALVDRAARHRRLARVGLRPAWWTWPILALIAALAPTIVAVLWGNTVIWSAALVALACRLARSGPSSRSRPTGPCRRGGVRPPSVLWSASPLSFGASLLLLPYWPLWIEAASNVAGWVHPHVHNLPVALFPLVVWWGRSAGRRVASSCENRPARSWAITGGRRTTSSHAGSATRRRLDRRSVVLATYRRAGSRLLGSRPLSGRIAMVLSPQSASRLAIRSTQPGAPRCRRARWRGSCRPSLVARVRGRRPACRDLRHQRARRSTGRRRRDAVPGERRGRAPERGPRHRSPGARRRCRDARARPSRWSSSIGTPVDEFLGPSMPIFERAVDDDRPAPPRRRARRPAQHRLPGHDRVRRPGARESAAARVDVAFCPERIAEGHALEELHTLPQIVGADDDRGRGSGRGAVRARSRPKTIRTTRRKPSSRSCSRTRGGT